MSEATRRRLKELSDQQVDIRVWFFADGSIVSRVLQHFKVGPVTAGWGCSYVCGSYSHLNVYESDPEVWDYDTDELHPIVMVRPVSAADFLSHATGRHEPRLALGHDQSCSYRADMQEFMALAGSSADHRMGFLSGWPRMSLAKIIHDSLVLPPDLVEPKDLGSRNVGEILKDLWDK